jgi:hydrogenase maturation protein HypF
VKGRVQGVGFRPFVYNLALQHHMKGSVSNNQDGVLIFVNATKVNADIFLHAIVNQAPEVSIITDTSITRVKAKVFSDFNIVASESNGQVSIPITPDFAICNRCKSDIEDPNNKRFQYAFTTCVNCGPRYAITTNFPFERAHTTLNSFHMCGSCQEEYENPVDRRFHSQTNSCSDCGIELKIVNQDGVSINQNQEQVLDVVSELVQSGHIIALKNTNGYLLCCDATNAETIQKLRTQKQRPNKPFAVMYPSLEAIKESFEVSIYEEQALTSEVAPIVIVNNKERSSIATQEIAPGLHQTGVMLPHTALLYLLLKQINKPIIATSGNIHGFPIISTEKDAQEQLSSVADYFVHHDLEINFPQDDSVVKYVEDQRIILRRSRGLAPNNLTETTPLNDVLATGADMKSAFAIAKNQQTYISQYFGNLASYDVLKRYNTTLAKFTDIFLLSPTTILVDKHPQYYSTQLGHEMASNHQLSANEIQHHKAHFASILGEHNLFDSKEKILGVVWDGTGLGDDNNIWGGEFFEYHNQSIQRITHFNYFNWIANDKMAKEPRLSLFSVLDEEQKNNIQSKFSPTEWKVYNKMLQNNQLKTSSVGRLFDAAASALDLADDNSYEAEASMLLEQCACQYSDNQPIDFLEGVSYEKIPSELIVSEIFKKYQQGVNKARLAYSFIHTLAQCIIRVANKQNIQTVACSGGVFQNSVLVKMLLNSNLDIKLHQHLSPNDENIAYGQLQYYQHIKEETHVFSNSRKNKGHYITA